MQAEDNTFIDAGDTSGQERSLLQAKINATRSLQEIAVEKLSSVFCFNYAGTTGSPPYVPMTLNYPSMNGNPVGYVPTSPDMVRSPYIYSPNEFTSQPCNTNIWDGQRIAGSFQSDPSIGFKAYGSGAGGGDNMIFDGTSSILPVWYGSSLGSPSVRSIDLIWGYNHAGQPVGQNWGTFVWGIRVIRPNGANVPVIICSQDGTIGQTTMQLPSGTGDIFGDGTLIIQVLHKVADSTAVPINFAYGSPQPNEMNIIRVTANILGANTPQPPGFPAIPGGVTTFPTAYSVGHTPTLFCLLTLT